MLGLKISEGEKHQLRGIWSPCNDTIWNLRKEKYFGTSIPIFRLVPHEKGGKLCQRQNTSHSFLQWLPYLLVWRVKGHSKGQKEFRYLACLCKSIKNVVVPSAIIITFFFAILMNLMVMWHFLRINKSTHNMLRYWKSHSKSWVHNLKYLALREYIYGLTTVS